MDINATLIGQMITFGFFILFTMKFVWPPMEKALEERRAKIADGLAAAEKGHQTLASAQANADTQLQETRQQAMVIIEEANKQAAMIIEEAKAQAGTEAQRIAQQAQAEIEQQAEQAREALRAEVAGIAILGAEKVIGTQIDAAAHEDMLSKLLEEV